MRSTRERIPGGSGGTTATASPVRRTRSRYDSSRCSGSRVTRSPVELSTRGFRRNLESSSATCLASAKLMGCTTAMGFTIPSPESFTGQVAAESLSPREKSISTCRIASSMYSVRFIGTSSPYHWVSAPAAVQDDPAAPEDESGPDGGEHRTKEDDENGRQGPR